MPYYWNATTCVSVGDQVSLCEPGCKLKHQTVGKIIEMTDEYFVIQCTDGYKFKYLWEVGPALHPSSEKFVSRDFDNDTYTQLLSYGHLVYRPWYKCLRLIET